MLSASSYRWDKVSDGRREMERIVEEGQRKNCGVGMVHVKTSRNGRYHARVSLRNSMI